MILVSVAPCYPGSAVTYGDRRQYTAENDSLSDMLPVTLVYHRVRSWGQLSLFCLLMISFLQLIMEISIFTQITQLHSLLEC